MVQLVRMGGVAVTLSIVAMGAANAQRGGGRGTTGLPRLTTAQPAPARGAVAQRGRGVATVPAGPSAAFPRGRPGDVPRITTRNPRGRSPYGTTHGRPRPGTGRSRVWGVPYTRWGVGAGCGFGCTHAGGMVRNGRFSRGFFIGFPFAFPVFVPYAYDVSYTASGAYGPDESAEAAYAEPRGGGKLIVVGAGTAGGDALTVEAVADSVRLTWLGSGRPAREVRLFVADSAQRPLATRSASPARPAATFEVATLSAPVAFAGVTVTFADGVVSTTMIPYQNALGPGRPR